ncbi:MAG TPA: AMP-binding protein [Ktedonobacteraceae bacterium]|nr:AMP-binding protein [Ktedonobacteraceae bacterium]
MAVSKIPNMTDYEAERRNFHLEVPVYFNFATDVIGKWASDPNKLAMLWVGQHGEEEEYITFAQFAERSSRAANAFATLGIQKGDRVLVMLPRIPEWWESALGLMKLGAIPIPCTTLLTPKDIQFRAEIAEPVALITDQEGVGKFDQVRGECPTIKIAVLADHYDQTAKREGWTSFQQIIDEASPEFTGPKTRSDDSCLVYFTSGTVGYPKKVLHTHASYPIGHTITGKYWLDLHEDDLLWKLSEMGWANSQH